MHERMEMASAWANEIAVCAWSSSSSNDDENIENPFMFIIHAFTTNIVHGLAVDAFATVKNTTEWCAFRTTHVEFRNLSIKYLD